MPVTPAHFGINAHWGNYDILPGGTFEQSVDLLGATAIRWPGGSVTENLSPADGTLAAAFDGAVGPDGQAPLREVAALCVAKGRRLQLVVPTRHMTASAIGTWAHRVLRVERDYPGLLDCIEIGNEYWGDGGSEADYAAVATLWLRALVNAGANALRVPIYVQAPEYWSGVDPMSIARLIPAALRPHVGGAVQHFYPGPLAHAISRDLCFDRLDASFPASLGYRPGLSRWMSEWNMSSQAPEPVTGMESAAGLIAAFHQMIRRGVDRATVWSVNYQNQGMKLTGIAPDGSVFVTPRGAAFRLLRAHTMGCDAIEAHLATHPACLSISFGNARQRTTFVCNTSAGNATVTADTTTLGSVTIAARKRLTWADNPATGGTETEAAQNAVGVVTNTPAPIAPGVLRTTLAPGEIWMVSIWSGARDLPTT